MTAQVIDLDQGSSVTVGPSGKLRFRYNESAGHLEISVDGAAYVAVVTL